jgi:hypothetical protein
MAVTPTAGPGGSPARKKATKRAAADKKARGTSAARDETAASGDRSGTPSPEAESPSQSTMTLSERVDQAFQDYVRRVEASVQSSPTGTGIGDAYAAYARAVGQVFTPPDLPKRTWEFYASYFRALQGTGRFEDAVPPYNQLLQATVDIGQRVVETYQALVTVLVQAAPSGRRDELEAAYARYARDVQRAWKDEPPDRLSAGVVFAVGQSTLAASSLHGVLMESVPADQGGAAHADGPAPAEPQER